MSKRGHLVLFILLSTFWPACSQGPEFQYLHGLGEVSYTKLESAINHHSYHVYVSVPDGVEANVKLQTLYALDGGLTFPILSAYSRYLNMGELVPKQIVVGISYGTDDWQEGNKRSQDYTAPSSEREFWGGAALFQRVLAEEIIPWVEKTVPSDPGKRILFGQSLGGQFVLYSAFNRPGLFWGHIASNPALHRNLSYYLETKPAAGDTRLFVSDGELDDDRFKTPARKWMAHWEAHKEYPWLLKTVILSGQTHMSAVPESYRQGMIWLMTHDN